MLMLVHLELATPDDQKPKNPSKRRPTKSSNYPHLFTLVTTLAAVFLTAISTLFAILTYVDRHRLQPPQKAQVVVILMMQLQYNQQTGRRLKEKVKPARRKAIKLRPTRSHMSKWSCGPPREPAKY